MLIIHRTVLRRRSHAALKILVRGYHASQSHSEKSSDPRIRDLGGNVIEDEFAVLREEYDAPQNPIILAHGLLGFDELPVLGLKYWRGITEALSAKGVEVITAAVPPSGAIEARAQKLAETIESKAGGKSVNIIA